MHPMPCILNCDNFISWEIPVPFESDKSRLKIGLRGRYGEDNYKSEVKNTYIGISHLAHAT